MRILCVLGVVCFLAGCSKSDVGPDARAKVQDPVMKTAGDQGSPAPADPGTRPAAYTAAKVPLTAQASADGAKSDPAPTSPADAFINKYIDSGVDGVVDIRTDKNGAINRVVVVSAVPLSTVLGAADGLLTARREARLRAAGKFRQFLKEKVSIEEKSETERIVKLESEKSSDLTESGKKISKFSDKYQTVSEGMVNGLQTLGFKTVSLNPKEKVYVLVCGWDAETSKAAGDLGKALDKDLGATAGKGSDSPGERRDLKDQQGVSPAAKKFFEKPQQQQ